MKKLLALAAAITLSCTAALAEFDFYALKDTPDAMTYTVPGTADTVVRPALAPYQGEFGEDELVAYLDYIILPDEEVATFHGGLHACAVQREFFHRNGAVEGEKRHDDAGRIRQHDGRRRAGRQRGDSQRGRENPADPLQ